MHGICKGKPISHVRVIIINTCVWMLRINVYVYFFSDNGQDFVPGYQGYGEFYPGPVPEGYPMNFLPPSGRGTPPLGMEHPLSRGRHHAQHLCRIICRFFANA